MVSCHSSGVIAGPLSLSLRGCCLQEKVIPRYSADGQMISKGPYNDMTLLGWYTYKECWMHRPEDLQPPVRPCYATGGSWGRSGHPGMPLLRLCRPMGSVPSVRPVAWQVCSEAPHPVVSSLLLFWMYYKCICIHV